MGSNVKIPPQTDRPGAAPSTSTKDARLSTIRALHERYEAACAEYNLIDEAKSALGSTRDEGLIGIRYEKAMKTSGAETGALRLAILYQVPECWIDAVILRQQIHIVTDMALNATMNDEERAAHAFAVDTLFDFMCCEVGDDHEVISRQFQRSANLVFRRRRQRTGELED